MKIGRGSSRIPTYKFLAMKESPIEDNHVEAPMPEPTKFEHAKDSAPLASTTKSEDVNFDEI